MLLAATGWLADKLKTSELGIIIYKMKRVLSEFIGYKKDAISNYLKIQNGCLELTL